MTDEEVKHLKFDFSWIILVDMNDNILMKNRKNTPTLWIKWATFQLQIYDIYTIKDNQVIFSKLPWSNR